MATTGSASPTHSSESSLGRSGDEGGSGAASGGHGDAYWRERCQTLEASLGKFKQQAAKIRELLADKVSINIFALPLNLKVKVSLPFQMHEHEARTLQAESRAERAEQMVSAWSTLLSWI